MNMIKKLLIIMTLLVSTFAKATVQPIDLAVFSQATLLAGNGRYKQAAQHYHKLSLQILGAESKLGTEKMWQYAGLAEALATVCANLDNDAKAYDYWANSIRYLLTGGTDWREMQQYLHRKNEQANTQLLTQVQTFDVAGGYDQGWEQDAAVLQVWQERLDLFAFAGPKIGLTRTQSPSVSSLSGVPTPAPVAPRVGVPGERKLKGIQSEFTQSHSFIPAQTNQEPESSDKSVTDTSLSTAKQLEEDNSSKSKLSLPPTNRHLINPTAVPVSDEVTVTNPIEKFDYQQLEQVADYAIQEPLNSESSRRGVNNIEPSPAPIAGLLQRGNLSSSSEQGVKAIQRRSFIPVTQTAEAEERSANND